MFLNKTTALWALSCILTSIIKCYMASYSLLLNYALSDHYFNFFFPMKEHTCKLLNLPQ